MSGHQSEVEWASRIDVSLSLSLNPLSLLLSSAIDCTLLVTSIINTAFCFVLFHSLAFLFFPLTVCICIGNGRAIKDMLWPWKVTLNYYSTAWVERCSSFRGSIKRGSLPFCHCCTVYLLLSAIWTGHWVCEGSGWLQWILLWGHGRWLVQGTVWNYFLMTTEDTSLIRTPQ